MEIINLKSHAEINFEEIINKKVDCDNEIKIINTILNKITIKYQELFKTMNMNVYLGIDSLNFQNKQYTIQYDYLKRKYNIIINRIYGDYYKIYKHIKKYIEIECNSIRIIDVSFNTYKDLEIDKIYSFDHVQIMQTIIHEYIKKINDIIVQKNIKIKQFINLNTRGFDVNYYVNEERTNICFLMNKIVLFIKYLDTCNSYHKKYLYDFFNQTRAFIKIITNDISFDDNGQIPNTNNIINTNNTNNINNIIQKNTMTLFADLSLVKFSIV
jgi:hypothetical protein